MNQKIYNVDKKMTDKGWNAMQEILDREMPAERSRRWIWMFWLLALLLPAAGMVLWLTSDQQASQPPVSTFEKPIAQQPAAAPHQEFENATAPNKTGTPTQSLVKTTTTPKSGVAVGSSPNPSPAKTIATYRQNPPATQTVAVPTPAAPAAYKQQPATNPTTLTIAAHDQKPSPEEITSTPVSLISAEGNPPPATNGLTETPPAAPTTSEALDQNPAPVPAEPAAFAADNPPPVATTQQVAAENPPPTADSPQPTPPPAAPAPIIPVREFVKAFSWGATAGVLSETSARFAGTTAGLTAGWQLGKRWGLRTGLAYQFHLLRNADRPITSLTTIAYAEVTGDQTVFESGLIANAQDFTTPVYVPVSRLHRLEIPVLVYWQPVSRLRLYGGLSGGSNLYVQSGNRTLKNGKTYDVKDGLPARNLNQEITNQYHDWYMGWNIGIGFRPIKQLEVGLFFQNPIALTSNSTLLFDTASAPAPTTKNSDTIETLSTERQSAAKGRPVLQFSVTAFF